MPKISETSRCYDASLEGAGPLLFGLKTLAMGDSCAVEIAQTAHLGILVQCGLVDESTLVSMTLPPPRSPSMLGVVIDDLILFELVARGVSVSDPSVKTGKMLDKALESYERLGLIAHPGKTFRLEEEAEFWGSHLDGVSGCSKSKSETGGASGFCHSRSHQAWYLYFVPSECAGWILDFSFLVQAANVVLNQCELRSSSFLRRSSRSFEVV